MQEPSAEIDEWAHRVIGAAIDRIHPIFLAQTSNYLKALDQPLALIINFNVMVLKDGIRRVVLTR